MISELSEKYIPDLCEIERLSFSDPWSENSFRESLASPFCHFFVFVENDIAQGYVGLYALSGEGSITNVATHPTHRRRGIGRALLTSAIEKGKALDLEYITLEVRESNESAIRLYEKMGFQKMGVRKNFYSKPKENALIMNYFFKKDN